MLSELTKTITTIRPGQHAIYENKAATEKEAASSAIKILNIMGELQLFVGEETLKYFYTSWSNKDKTTAITFSNLDNTIVDKIKQMATQVGIHLHEIRLQPSIEMHSYDKIPTNCLFRVLNKV